VITDFIIKAFSFGCKGSREQTPELNYGRYWVERFINNAMPFRSVLDLGAGRGCDLLTARRVNPSTELHAVETFEPNVLHLRQLNIDAHVLDLERERLPFSDGSMDVVIANQILEHTKEVFWICHEITRVLRIGGTVIIGVPNLASLHNRILLFLGRQPSPLKTASAHVRGFTRHDIMHFLSVCFPEGYRPAGFGGSNFYPFPPFLACPLSRLFPNASWGIFMAFKKMKHYDREFLDYPGRHRLETNFFTGACFGSEPQQ
jgi:SAM-dependent methyltransferase